MWICFGLGTYECATARLIFFCGQKPQIYTLIKKYMRTCTFAKVQLGLHKIQLIVYVSNIYLCGKFLSKLSNVINYFVMAHEKLGTLQRVRCLQSINVYGYYFVMFLKLLKHSNYYWFVKKKFIAIMINL